MAGNSFIELKPITGVTVDQSISKNIEKVKGGFGKCGQVVLMMVTAKRGLPFLVSVVFVIFGQMITSNSALFYYMIKRDQYILLFIDTK